MTFHNNKSTKQLIILGNGFDLACKLKSSYFDFFQYHFAEVAKHSTIQNYYERELLNKNFEDILKKISFWDVIFIYEYCNQKLNEQSEWNNIEDTIYKVLHYLVSEDSSTNLSGATKGLLDNFKHYRIYYSDFIFKELIKFENCFNNYIFEQIDSNNNYFNTFVPQKLSMLIKDDLLGCQSKNLSILSFNYTLTEENTKNIKISPSDTFMLSTSDELSTPLVDILNTWVNIHGKVDNERIHEKPIIFGIDLNTVNKLNINSSECKLEVKFTKTFRTAINNFSHSTISLPQTIDLITFYGHSLSSADFSYFESIFDMYNLYNSNLKLEFYYGTYSFLHEAFVHKIEEKSKFFKYFGDYINNQNDQNRQTLMTNVYRLLENYGSSLNNNHGSNLLHRLLLEGRIAFKEDNGSFELTESQFNNIKDKVIDKKS